ncbi:MAG: recombinase family protein [Bdellovibrionaceae bacterium]|nr:recombinase family protein [Pseudobdellovibrionaceae bacterium]
MVEQPEIGTNTPYLVDFVKITLLPKLLNFNEIRSLYLDNGLSAAQIARECDVAKSVIVGLLNRGGIRPGPHKNRSNNPENYRLRVPPYGFQIRAGKLVPSRTEMMLCRLVVELIQRQGFSANAVAKELGRRGLKNRSGGIKWDHSTVRSIFKRWKDRL